MLMGSIWFCGDDYSTRGECGFTSPVKIEAARSANFDSLGFNAAGAVAIPSFPAIETTVGVLFAG